MSLFDYFQVIIKLFESMIKYFNFCKWCFLIEYSNIFTKIMLFKNNVFCYKNSKKIQKK